MRIFSLQQTAETLKKGEITQGWWIFYYTWTASFISSPFIRFYEDENPLRNTLTEEQEIAWLLFLVLQQIIILFLPYLVVKKEFSLKNYLQSWSAFAFPVTVWFFLIFFALLVPTALVNLFLSKAFPNVPEDIVMTVFAKIVITIITTTLFINAFKKYKTKAVREKDRPSEN